MNSLEPFSRELRIERPGVAVSLQITPEQQQEIVRYAIDLLRGYGGSSVEFASTETGREEISLRTMLLLERSRPDGSLESIIEKEAALDTLTASRRHHLIVKLGERKKRYSELTEHIGELDRDMGICTDSERRLELRNRRKDLEEERDKIADEMSSLEEQLSQIVS